ncbi:hypothetical protein EYF80_046631 [Liparis tanakae]|uniref:Uncharacterized protein n=1 Tax=Liparis tanakae TaxID=230148 RepID=A0A4Z2FR52_9TELE|nr:hypothetical protein EYF80_046631 [Liparis tanakae]
MDKSSGDLVICTFSTGLARYTSDFKLGGTRLARKGNTPLPGKHRADLHPGFISTIQDDTLVHRRVQLHVSGVQPAADCHHSSSGLDVALVHCRFTGSFLRDRDGNPAAAPGDFLAGLGACIGAVQSVYLHGLLATVNEGSSPGRSKFISNHPPSPTGAPGSGPSVHPASGPHVWLVEPHQQHITGPQFRYKLEEFGGSLKWTPLLLL